MAFSKYTVRVPDGEDWTITIYHCEKWIEDTWPGLAKAMIGSETWDYNLTFGSKILLYQFRDPKKAMLFKLAWGE